MSVPAVPEEPQPALFDAFGLVVQYDQPRSEVQVSVTLTTAWLRRSARPRTRTAAPRRAPSSFLPPFG